MSARALAQAWAHILLAAFCPSPLRLRPVNTWMAGRAILRPGPSLFPTFKAEKEGTF